LEDWVGRFAGKAFLAAQLLGVLSVAAAQAQTGGVPEAGKPATPIPLDQIGAAVAKQYSGDGLAVLATPEGARFRCAFQKLEGAATREGLWLTSTAEGGRGEKFRVVAAAVGRNDGSRTALPATGEVEVKEQLVRFLRPGLVEEYSVSVDGVRQDFIVESRPAGAGQLRVELAVSGAKVESLADGARLVLAGSGRKLNYSRLTVKDANGKDLAGRLQVTGQSEPRNAASKTGLAVLVDDTEAAYPIRIDPTFSDANWVSMGSICGADQKVFSAVVDGSGNLYIGGDFTVVGDIVANRIAKWNGSSWSALGLGMNSTVHALSVLGSDVYAGGLFSRATNSDGIAVTARNIAKWDGSGWSALGSGMAGGTPYPKVSALAVSGTNVYAGGSFTLAGGIPVYRIAKWDGSTWSALGSGMNSDVAALIVSGNDLYAGGYFTTAGGVEANRIAKWSGGTWSPLGSGLNSNVSAVAVAGGDMFAGGHFTTAGGVEANRIAKWDGTNWSALGSGMNSYVWALAAAGGDVYAGGLFTTAGGVVANRIAKWNGTSWSALGSGMNERVLALVVNGSDVLVGGDFTTAGGDSAGRIAKWNGSAWSAYGTGINGSVLALTVSGSDVYAGGQFVTIGGGVANHVAKWDGSAWRSLGSGVGGGSTYPPVVFALAATGSNVFAAGNFTTAGGMTANYVAQWNGTTWSALGSGMNYWVSTLAVVGSNLYAGGWFTTADGSAANYIAKWDGSVWSALGSGMNERVFALAASDNGLYAGGLFTTAGGSAANYVARWNGSTWSALGSGVDHPYTPTVSALAVSGSELYVGGDFDVAGGLVASNVAKWNGSMWSALGSGVSSSVDTLLVLGGDVYAGGHFITAGGSAASSIAKWDGSVWSSLGSGVNGSVETMAVVGTDLYMGGTFSIAGGKVSGYIARAILPPFIVTTNGPLSFTLVGPIGSNALIQASTDLQAWTPLLTNSLTRGSVNFTDSLATNFPRRFYRALLLP